jgi:hypothetical protein
MTSDSSVSIHTGYVRGSITSRSKRFFSLLHSFQTGSGPTEPPIQRALLILSLGLKWPGREVDISLPSNAEIKNGGAIPPFKDAR